jgi:hypothetical protein
VNQLIGILALKATAAANTAGAENQTIIVAKDVRKTLEFVIIRAAGTVVITEVKLWALEARMTMTVEGEHRF